MSLFRRPLFAIVLGATCLIPIPATAAIITLDYQVTVTGSDRLDFSGIIDPIDPITFMMTLTFDDGVTSSSTHDFASFVQRRAAFGAPVFSPVPLSGVGPDLNNPVGGSQILSSTGLFHEVYALAPENNVYSAGAGYYVESGPNVARSSIELSTEAPFDAPLDLQAYLAIMQGTLDFRYQSLEFRDFAYVPGSVFLYGTATYVEPVPEPATLVLLASGLIGGARFARRRKSGATTT
jgi:hypothetical protein